jgi:hypothetical protein
MIYTFCAAMLLMVRPAIAGFRCGPNGKPKREGPIGCDCPAGKQSLRDGSDWVCATIPPVEAPELKSPPAGARDVDEHTQFSVSRPKSVDALEIEICRDRACRDRWRSDNVAATAPVVSLTWTQLPPGQEMYWRARGRKAGRWGPFSTTHAFTTAARAEIPPPDHSGAQATSSVDTAKSPESIAEPDRPVSAASDLEVIHRDDRRSEGSDSGAGVTPPPPAKPPRTESPGSAPPTSPVEPKPPSTQSDRSSGGALRLASYATGGLGVASLGLGLAFAFRAHSLSAEHSRAGNTYDNAKDEAGRAANRITIIGIAGGSALIATSATLFWLNLREKKSAGAITLAPMAFDHGAVGVVMTGVLR